jgi:hypothetical protein
MSSVPSLNRLRGDIGKTYLLSGPWDGPIAAEVRTADEGVPMNSSYCCYSAKLALPSEVWLPQLTCTVTAGQDEWFLLLTPLGPGSDGRQLMQMVFHCLLPQAAQAPATV